MEKSRPVPVAKPEDFGLPRTRPAAIIKLQSVIEYPVFQSHSDRSIGQIVDDLLQNEHNSERVPNKLVIDLNPRIADPADVEST